MSTDTGQQETEEFLPRARMRVKLEYADTMEEGALWEELERRYNAHEDLVAALRQVRINLRAGLLSRTKRDLAHIRMSIGEIDDALAKAEGA